MSIHLEDHISAQDWTLSTVYSLCDEARKTTSLSEIHSLGGKWGNCWCLCGDFNIITLPQERTGVSQSSSLCGSFLIVSLTIHWWISQYQGVNSLGLKATIALASLA